MIKDELKLTYKSLSTAVAKQTAVKTDSSWHCCLYERIEIRVKFFNFKLTNKLHSLLAVH